MRKHNGMRPQDVAVLLKIISKADQPWQNKDLAAELYISPSEISESLNRSSMGGLIDANNKKNVFRQSLMEFLEHGLHYVFPAHPGSMVNGIYTAHSHPFMQKEFKAESLHYVWPQARGQVRGLSIEPLYKEQVKAVLKDETLYLMLALLDVIRVGRVREMKFAIQELKRQIL
jgi:DNA-binding MarR family transcriptional regulator